jgi:hypothetical protein
MENMMFDSMRFYNRRYWGSSIYSVTEFTVLTDTVKDSYIQGLDGASIGSGSEFATNRLKSYDGINGAGNYLIFSFPVSFGTPTFKQDGLTNTAFSKDEYTFTNNQDYGNQYQVWIFDSQYNGVVASFSII